MRVQNFTLNYPVAILHYYRFLPRITRINTNGLVFSKPHRFQKPVRFKRTAIKLGSPKCSVAKLCRLTKLRFGLQFWLNLMAVGLNVNLSPL